MVCLQAHLVVWVLSVMVYAGLFLPELLWAIVWWPSRPARPTRSTRWTSILIGLVMMMPEF
ncbi:hypothetical protein G4B88_028809, partial [Cannabis sativa]